MPRLWSIGLLTLLLLLCGGVALRADAAPPMPAAQALPAGAPGCWVVVPGAFPIDRTTELHSVAAFAANDVWTVGFKQNNVGTFPLVEHWDGQTWAEGGPAPHDHGPVYAVGGTAGNDVWVAGSAFFHWDGTQWSAVAHPSSAWLYGLVALAPNDVWAVGDDFEHWDGTAWAVVPHPGGGKTGVAGTGSNDIWAVGSDIEHWDGTAWTVVPAPLTGATLNSVAALAPNDAWAVGTISGATAQTYTLHWDGTAWTVAPSPNPGPSSYLNGVVALAANDVWAVGEYYGYSYQQTLTEHWDGSAWTVVPSLNNTYRDNRFYAVAAVTTSDLWAVGTSVYGLGHAWPNHLIEHYIAPCPPPPPPVCNTGWDIVRSPSTENENNFLRAVGMVSATNVWAVGEHGGHTLIEHWDGQDWTYQASPDVGNLNAITVRAAHDIWAAGDGFLHWDGAQWSVVPVPPGTVYGLVALAANDAWAVGQGTSGPLTEHWNGSTWTVVPNPATHPLRSIAGLGANDLWAVGGQERGGGTAVLLHWNGATWNNAALPTPAPDELRAVTALATDNVWAVGHSYSSGGLYSMHWDGTSWSSVPFPGPGGTYYLYSVSGTGPNDLWAVGAEIYDPLALAAHWDGTAWEQIWLPQPTYNDEAYSVAALAPGDAWAVGHFDRRATTWHYSGPCSGRPPTPTPTPPPSATRTATAIVTASPSPTSPIASPTLGGPTSTPLVTLTPTPRPAPPTLTPCALAFGDVPSSSPFYPYIRCLACRGILSGYSTSPPCAPGGAPCFLPGNPVTRGQAAKLIANAAGFSDAVPSTQQTFGDVPPSQPFWLYIERAALHGVITGYTTSPPCPPSQVPCFLPAASVTRGQLAKMATQAAGLSAPVPSTQQTFEDVSPANPFWLYIERLAPLGVISGYTCGQAPAGPCVPPLDRPYFLPANLVTRGQTAKIVANTFYPSCATPVSGSLK